MNTYIDRYEQNERSEKQAVFDRGEQQSISNARRDLRRALKRKERTLNAFLAWRAAQKTEGVTQ